MLVSFIVFGVVVMLLGKFGDGVVDVGGFGWFDVVLRGLVFVYDYAWFRVCWCLFW